MLYPNYPMLDTRLRRPAETPSGLAHGVGLGSNMVGIRAHSAVFDGPQGRGAARTGIRPTRGLKPEEGKGGTHGATLP